MVRRSKERPLTCTPSYTKEREKIGQMSPANRRHPEIENRKLEKLREEKEGFSMAKEQETEKKI